MNKYKGNYRKKPFLNSLINDYRHSNLRWYIQIYGWVNTADPAADVR